MSFNKTLDASVLSRLREQGVSDEYSDEALSSAASMLLAQVTPALLDPRTEIGMLVGKQMGMIVATNVFADAFLGPLVVQGAIDVNKLADMFDRARAGIDAGKSNDEIADDLWGKDSA